MLVPVGQPHRGGQVQVQQGVQGYIGRGVVWGGFDFHGRPLEQIVNRGRARQEGIELENMKSDIKAKVDRASMNQKMEEECFYLLHTNVFSITAEGGVVPAEMSLARVSLRQGVE